MNIDFKGRPGIHTDPNYDTGYKSALYYINNNIPLNSHKLKLKLIREGLKPDYCEICGAKIWQNKLLPLELHHKNNNHFDNRLENLQILCPNCHSIQEGNSGANIKKYSETDNKIINIFNLESEI